MNYFEAYLQRLKSVDLTESFLGISGKTKNALEWLIIEAEDKAEQINKAIELRAPVYSVGYIATDRKPQFQTGDIIGRFYYSRAVDKGSLPIEVDKTLVCERTFKLAEMATRNSSYMGLRVVVPGSDGLFYGYAVTYRLICESGIDSIDRMLGCIMPELDPGGHYYWYYPGTLFISTGIFQREFAVGGKPEQKQRTEIFKDAITRASAVDTSPLFGLDYDVLSIASVDERVKIMHIIFFGRGWTTIPGTDLLVRLLQSTPEAEKDKLHDRLETEGLLQKLLDLSNPGITAALGRPRTQQDQDTLDTLEGTEDLFSLLDLYFSNPHESFFAAFQDFKKLSELSKESGFEKVSDFIASASSFNYLFQRFALQTAYKILDENEELVKGEYARYGGDVKGGGVAALRAEIEPLKKQVEARDAAREYLLKAEKELSQAKNNPANFLIGGQTDILDKQLKRAQAQKNLDTKEASLKEIIVEMVPRFPVLADPKLDLTALVHADDASMQRMLQNRAIDVLDKISRIRLALEADPSLVWQMEGALARTQKDMHIVPGSVYDMIIKARIKAHKVVETFKNLLIAAFAIGLGLLSGGKGTVAVLATQAGVGLSIYQAMEHIRKFVLQQAAAGTAFDRAKALSAEDPSLFWLAVDIAVAIFDFTMACKAMSKLSPVVKEAVEATDDVTKLAKLQKLKAVANEVEEEVKAAKHLAKSKVEGLAHKIVADAEKRIAGKEALKKLGKEGEALKTLVKGDEAAAGGLARIESATRVHVLKALEGNADGLRKLGNMALDDSTARALEAIEKAFVGKAKRPDQFKAILNKYVLTTNERGAENIFKALGEVAVAEDDLAKMVAEMSRMKAAKNIGTEFGKKSLTLIAEKLPPGKDGIKKIVAMKEWMEPSQAGSIFEQWCRRHIYPEGMGRFSAKASDIPGNYTRTRVTSDTVLDTGTELTIVDMKNMTSGGTFSAGTNEGKQLLNYAELIKNSVKGKNGKLIKNVEYLFSTEDAAEKAARSIKDVLGKNAKIFYIDLETGLKTLL